MLNRRTPAKNVSAQPRSTPSAAARPVSLRRLPRSRGPSAGARRLSHQERGSDHR
jgi:hypothetical protein